MSKIVVTEFVSLDGVMEEPRWTFSFDRGPDGDKFKYDELFEADALLLGRVTYQGFAQAWPSMGQDNFGKRMNEIPKFVVSSTLADADATWGPTTVIRDDIVTQLTELKAQDHGTLLVEGSAQLVHLLAQHGLVDEYRLMVFPVILGSGKRAYPGEMSQPGTLKLTNSRVSEDVLLLNYEPAEAKEPTGLPGQPDSAA